MTPVSRYGSTPIGVTIRTSSPISRPASSTVSASITTSSSACGGSPVRSNGVVSGSHELPIVGAPPPEITSSVCGSITCAKPPTLPSAAATSGTACDICQDLLRDRVPLLASSPTTAGRDVLERVLRLHDDVGLREDVPEQVVERRQRGVGQDQRARDEARRPGRSPARSARAGPSSRGGSSARRATSHLSGTLRTSRPPATSSGRGRARPSDPASRPRSARRRGTRSGRRSSPRPGSWVTITIV